MKIPVYTAQASVTREAPGRQIRARQSPSAMAQAELDKEKPMSAALKAAGEYAKTRYNIQTQNNLDKALLDAEEGLNERLRELQKSPDYNNILDGDDPLWDKETNELLQASLKKVGTDRYARQQLTSRFANLEQRGRFQLRDFIDEKIKATAKLNRDRNLQSTQDEIINRPDLANTMLKIGELDANTKKLGAIGAGNREILSEQQYTVLKNGAAGALEKYADESPSGITFIKNIKLALQEKVVERKGGKSTAKTAISSREEAYVLGLIKMLKPSDQAKLLKDAGAVQEFLETDTIVQRNNAKLASNAANEISESIEIRAERLSKGDIPSSDQINQIDFQIASLKDVLSEEKFNELVVKSANFKELASIQKTLSRGTTTTNIDQVKETIKKGIKNRNLSGIDTPFEVDVFNLIDNHANEMIAAFSPDGDAIDFARKNKMDRINIQPVDLSIDTVVSTQGPSDLAFRIEQGKKLKVFNNLDYVPVLTKDEYREVIANIQANPAMAGTYLDVLRGSLSPRDSAFFLDSLAREGLAAEYIVASYAPDARAREDIASLAGRTRKDIEVGVNPSFLTGAGSIPVQLIENRDVQNYKEAFLIGGDEIAEKKFNDMYRIAENLAVSYIKDGRFTTVDEALKFSIKNVFSGQVSQNINFAKFIAPDDVNLAAVEDALLELKNVDNLQKFNILPLRDERYTDFQNEAVNVTSLQTTGVWLNNSTGDGVTLHYALNGTYLPVQIQGGGYLEVPFSVLNKLNLEKVNAFDGKLDLFSLRKMSTGYVSADLGFTGTGTQIEGAKTFEETLPLTEEQKKNVSDSLKGYFSN